MTVANTESPEPQTVWVAFDGEYSNWFPIAAYASLELLIGANPGEWSWRCFEGEKPYLDGPVDAIPLEFVTDGPLGEATRLLTLPKSVQHPRSPESWVESTCNPDGSPKERA